MFWKDDNLLATLAAEIDDLIAEVEALRAGEDRDALVRRPAEGAWSAAECIDHLNATARLYVPVFRAAIGDARADPRAGSRADGRTLLGRLVCRAMEPPPRLRTRTYAEIEPAASPDPEEVAAEFVRAHRELVDVMNGSAGLDRKRVRIRSVLDPRLRLSLDDWYAFIAAHGRRHLWQARAALDGA